MIGLAGCGRMGAPMLEALRDGGTHATGFDIKPKAASFITSDVDNFRQNLTTLFTVVRDATESHALLFDDQNLIGTCPTLERIVLCSTLSPRYVRALRGRVPNHIILIDAPMSGAAIGAETRSLSFMIGGTDQDVADIIPLLSLMGDSFHHMGEYGAGMHTKVLNNLLAASHTAMTRLVLDWAEGAKLDHDKLLAVIEASSGQNWLASGFNTIEFAKHGYSPDNSIGILEKDISAALDAAPKGSDTKLPNLIQTAIKALTPYSE